MISSEERRIIVERSARYYVAGTPGPGIEHIWMLCHGYGQLAGDFLEDCSLLAGEKTLLVAPEGLSRFYHRGGRGSIGASWMTSADRLAEIEDYLAYLNAVWEEICGDCTKEPKVSVLGFSQGGATAARWGLRGGAVVERLVLWGAAIPESDIVPYGGALRRTRLVLVEGEHDPLVKREEREKSLEALRIQEIPFTLMSHPGGHELEGEILRRLASSV